MHYTLFRRPWSPQPLRSVNAFFVSPPSGATSIAHIQHMYFCFTSLGRQSHRVVSMHFLPLGRHSPHLVATATASFMGALGRPVITGFSAFPAKVTEGSPHLRKPPGDLRGQPSDSSEAFGDLRRPSGMGRQKHAKQLSDPARHASLYPKPDCTLCFEPLN